MAVTYKTNRLPTQEEVIGLIKKEHGYLTKKARSFPRRIPLVVIADGLAVVGINEARGSFNIKGLPLYVAGVEETLVKHLNAENADIEKTGDKETLWERVLCFLYADDGETEPFL